MNWHSFQIPTNHIFRSNLGLYPKVTQDGNQFCILFGNDIQTGVCGFGPTIKQAINEWNEEWSNTQMNNSPDVIISGPQFDRIDNIEPTREGLYSEAQFLSLKKKPASDLMSMGCQIWSISGINIHWLYPEEWYDIIPNGLEIIHITGKTEIFVKGETSNDCRFGALSFGFIKENIP